MNEFDEMLGKLDSSECAHIRSNETQPAQADK